MDGTFNYSAIWTPRHRRHGGGGDDAAEAEALVAEEAARMETQAAAEAAAAAREALLGPKSAEELLRHTEAALNDEPAPPTPVAAASPLALAQFEASVAALAAPAADLAAEPTPMAPVEAKELAELDVTLEATELRIQLLHATLNPPAPTPVVADADDADEADADGGLNPLAALSLRLPAARYTNDQTERKVAAESTLRDAHETKRAEKGSPEKAALAAPLAASWADEYVGSQEDDDDDDYDEAWGEEEEMEAVDEEYDDFDEDEEFEASEEEEGEEEAGGEVSVVRVPQLEKRSEQLRQACARQLGADIFAAVYKYLRSKSASAPPTTTSKCATTSSGSAARKAPLLAARRSAHLQEDVEKDAHRHVDDCW